MQDTFQIHRYSPAVQTLLAPDRISPAAAGSLGPGRPNREVASQLARLRAADIVASPSIADVSMANCCLAGLWLRHGFLDESHRLSQEIETSSGSFWHAIMHRREPDYGNAKYWFRRVGKHPIFATLCRDAREMAGLVLTTETLDAEARYLQELESWDPCRFVDLCQYAYPWEAREPSSPSLLLTQRIARREWELLFDFCYQVARGES